jgi:hypothetical protein
LTNLGWVNHIAMTRVARGIGMERGIRHTLQMKIKRESSLAKIIVMIHGVRGIGTERDMKHTSRVLFQKKLLLKNSLILLKEIHIHTVMTQDVRLTGTERHRPHSPDNPDSYYIKYKGGHNAYPSPTATRMHFYEDRIVVDNPELVISYRFMKNIENIHENRISALRVVVLGLIFVPLAIVGAMWKKNHIYTIIRFRDDDDDDQKIIVDFDKNLDSAQSVIYKRMLEFRKARKLFQNLEM